MRYWVCYKGSKNTIIPFLMSQFPKKTHFYDMFAGGFNHAEFYKWARNQKELVIISEYSMPKDFVCVAETEKTVTLCSGGNKKAIEKLFIPEHQKELWESVKPKVYRQLEFSF